MRILIWLRGRSLFAPLATHSFDAAMLDVNLNGEISYPIADVLTQRGIPFAFSTGYRDHGDRTDLDGRPVLRKPYSNVDFQAVLGQLIANDQGGITAEKIAPAIALGLSRLWQHLRANDRAPDETLGNVNQRQLFRASGLNAVGRLTAQILPSMFRTRAGERTAAFNELVGPNERPKS